MAPKAANVSASYQSTPFKWSGLYFGVNGGYGAGATTGGQYPAYFAGNYDINGGLLGGQVGFNYQINHLVLGVEANWDWANVSAFGPNSGFGSTTTIGDLATVRGRIGYAWDRLLLYGTGGWAWSNVTATCENCSLSGPVTERHALTGYALGAGLEYGVNPNFSLKAEYLYASLSPTNYFISAGCPGPCTIGAQVHTFLLGANLRFGGNP